MVKASMEEIGRLFETHGAGRYESGRPDSVSQLEHALQCAMHAERAGAGPALITAALLHDLGHLVYEEGEFGHDSDDEHETRALPYLRHLFPDAVLEPIRLHVNAKRYLCHAEPAYWSSLSITSKHTLVLQGGIYDAEMAEDFITRPHAPDAVNLRRWDDLAKSKSCVTPPIAHFLDIARSVAIAPGTAVA
jgi:phosphonate degradation associated HDIG domain protein